MDDNRLEPGRDYVLNPQDGKRPFDARDAAATSLFSSVDRAVLSRPTFRAFHSLLDNYKRETNAAEVMTAAQRQEVTDFLDAITQTRPMRYCQQYLAAKNAGPPDMTAFKHMLHQMWFAPYSRDGTRDASSGFEHVFVGEINQKEEVSGLHNWIQFWLEEQKGSLDYKGYILPKRTGPRASQQVDAQERLLAVQFDWYHRSKNVTTLFIGSSPEFELALYTLVFNVGGEHNYVNIDNYEVDIRAYAINSHQGAKVGSCFPELISEM